MKFFASFVIFSLLLNVFATAQTLIQDSCKKAAAIDPNIKYEFCFKTLDADPESKAATSLVGLLTSSTKIAASKMISMKATVVNLLKTKRPLPMKRALDDCLDLYSDSVSGLDEALTFIKSADYVSANTYMSSALISSKTCETSFKELKQKSPLTSDNKIFFDKIVIPLTFTRMV